MSQQESDRASGNFGGRVPNRRLKPQRGAAQMAARREARAGVSERREEVEDETPRDTEA